MSLTAEQAIESAMSYLKDAELCLYDAVGNCDVHKEMEELYLKEDIDFNCKSLLNNKRTLSAQFVCFSGKALTNSGGVCDVRTSEKEREQAAMMIDKYGQMLTLRVSVKGNGVRKKAVQFGIR